MYGITPFERRGFDLFDAFRDFDNDFFGDLRGVKTDIKDKGDKYVLEAELPGFEKEDIKIDITGGTLTLSAERSSEKTDENKNEGYIRRERRQGSYRRSFDLSGVDAEKIAAEYKNGVLYLDLPKKQAQTPTSRRLEIKG